MYFTVVNSVDLRENLVRFIGKYAVDVNLFRLGSSILKHAESSDATPVGGVGGKAPQQK